jgi:predicted membrane chloride channel (bestrophin family)
MDENGDLSLVVSCGELMPPARSLSRAAAAGFGAPAAAYAVKGFLKVLFAFCGAGLG